MTGNEGIPSRAASWAGPVALLAAGAAALWFWQALGTSVPLGLLALTVAVGGIWLYRQRAARRLVAALDTYAEQELARAERRPRTLHVTGRPALSRSNA
jgi:hypothetical protein